MTPQGADTLLSTCFAPNSVAQFFAELAGRVTHHKFSESNGFRRDLLGTDPAATIFDGYSGLAGHVKVVRADDDDTTAPKAVFDDRRSLVGVVEKALAAGHSLMIHNADAVGGKVALLKRALEQVTGVPVHPTIFWAPPNGGTKVHRDPIDTLTMQVRGSKSWLISTEKLDYPNPWSEISPGAGGLKACNITRAENEPHAKILLEPGDMLYVPKGPWHEVRASDSESISVAFGFRLSTTSDILNIMINYLSDREPTLRSPTGTDLASAPTDGAPPAQAQDFAQAFSRVATYYRSEACFEDALRWKRARFIGDLPALAATGGRAASVTDRVKLADMAICSVSANGSSAVLSYPGDHLTAPAAFDPAFRFIAATEQFQIQDMPGKITDQSKLKIVNKLITAGVLELST